MSSSRISIGLETYVIKKHPFDLSVSGVLAPAATGKRLRAVGFELQAHGTVEFEIRSGDASGTVLRHSYSFQAREGLLAMPEEELAAAGLWGGDADTGDDIFCEMITAARITGTTYYVELTP